MGTIWGLPQPLLSEICLAHWATRYVAVNGVRAPVSSVMPNQIVFQIPSVTRSGSASVVGVVDGIVSSPLDVQIADVSSGSNPLAIRIHIPGVSSAPFLGTISASGSAVDPQSALQNIHVLVDSIPVGSAQYGLPRPDVCTA